MSLSPNSFFKRVTIISGVANVLILGSISIPKNFAKSNPPPPIPPPPNTRSVALSPYTICLGCGGVLVVNFVTCIAACRKYEQLYLSITLVLPCRIKFNIVTDDEQCPTAAPSSQTAAQIPLHPFAKQSIVITSL